VSQSSPARSTDRRWSVKRSAITAGRLTLLNAFELVCDGTHVALPMSAQRLLAFLALHPRQLLRPFVAGTLWPETTDERAHASLRSALWRLHRFGYRLVEANGSRLRLGAAVELDLRDAEAFARRVLDETDTDVVGADPSLLFDDLLPDWYEDWVLLERERFRQLRLRALDTLCQRLMCAGRLGDASDVGLAALAAEPLRESAHRALVRIHLAEGNTGEALRQYRLCRRLLGEQLGIQPSEQMEQLVGSVMTPETVA
jgi:DNA-binding SARP family transcriptional activator